MLGGEADKVALYPNGMPERQDKEIRRQGDDAFGS
jgi:hypothetical protein